MRLCRRGQGEAISRSAEATSALLLAADRVPCHPSQVLDVASGAVTQTLAGVSGAEPVARHSATCMVQWQLHEESSSPYWCPLHSQHAPLMPLIIAPSPQDSEPITALALSPDARHLYAASRSLQLRCWSLESGQVLRGYKGHKAPIADIVVDGTGGLLATASADRSVRVWDADAGFCTHAFTGHRWVVAVQASAGHAGGCGLFGSTNACCLALG